MKHHTIKNHINYILSKKPYIGITIITAISMIVSLVVCLIVLYAIDVFYMDIDAYYYNITIFCSLFDAFLIAPLISYHVIKIAYSNQILIKKLDYISKYDALTKIKNRRYSMKLASKEIAVSKKYKYPFSMIILDLDNFKHINDTYGHLFGDNILVKFSHIVENSIRKNDIFARYGGDEFMIFCPHTNLEDALYLAEKIKKNLKKKFILHKKEVTISSSMGVASLDLHKEQTLEELIQNADLALYKAKEKGRNRIEILSH